MNKPRKPDDVPWQKIPDLSTDEATALASQMIDSPSVDRYVRTPTPPKSATPKRTSHVDRMWIAVAVAVAAGAFSALSVFVPSLSRFTGIVVQSASVIVSVMFLLTIARGVDLLEMIREKKP